MWLEDSINNRLLVWNPSQPDNFARAVPVPYGAGMSDVALGPGGTLYVTRKLIDPTRLVLDKLDATTGRLFWETRVGLEYVGGPHGNSYPLVGSGSPLRTGSDGTLYYFVGLPGGQIGWLPVATAAGKPLAPRVQVSGVPRLLPGAHCEPAADPAGRRRGDPLAERERQHETLVVVGVLAHQVGPPRGQPHPVRLPAEPPPEKRSGLHRDERAWVKRQASAAKSSVDSRRSTAGSQSAVVNRQSTVDAD